MKDKLYKMMSWPQIEAIVYGEEGTPQTILGRHYISAYTLYQCFIPNAESVNLIIEGDKKKIAMEMADEAGFFAIAILGKELRDYKYEVHYKENGTETIYDPYSFECAMNAKDISAWKKGVSRDAYRFMGAHYTSINGVDGVVFRVWAPNAVRVSVIGVFNDFNPKTHPMMLDEETGIYSLFIPGLRANTSYCYEICSKGNKCIRKLDPYAHIFDDESGLNLVPNEEEYKWSDSAYMESRKDIPTDSATVNIFEVDDSLWAENASSMNDKNCKEIIDYVSGLGYTHVLINISSDSLFILNSKISSDSFVKKLVDGFHANNIGVLFKWNPSYFSPADDGLKCFDGTYLYGHLDEKKRYNAMFGYNYNYSREEVRNYLISNVFYLFEEYHFDGIHVEEISTILYLDYGREQNDYTPNMYGGNENLDATDFLKLLNNELHTRYKGIITTTKETCMYPNVTESVNDGGLGFDYIWDNGFGDDYLEFLKNPDAGISKLTDSMAYAYSENYILTISKEDVYAANDYDYERVASGCGYFDYIAFDDTFKMAAKRATLSYFMAHPGKKLIYIGQDEKNLSIKLNKLYTELPAFYSLDRYKEGFEWVCAWASKSGIIAFMRKGEIFKDCILVVCNFTTTGYETYKLGVPYEGKYTAIMCSEEKAFGGDFKLPSKKFETVTEEYDGKDCTITIPLPAMSVTYYSYDPYTEDEFIKIARKKAQAYKKELEKQALERAKELEEDALRKAKEYNSLEKIHSSERLS